SCVGGKSAALCIDAILVRQVHRAVRGDVDMAVRLAADTAIGSDLERPPSQASVITADARIRRQPRRRSLGNWSAGGLGDDMSAAGVLRAVVNRASFAVCTLVAAR